MKTQKIIDGVVYVPENSNRAVKNTEGLVYVIVRTYSAGVFAGYLESQKEQEVVLKQARRIWYWAGANSLSELAMKGTSKPDECKFPIEVESIKLLNAIEIIDCTEEARKSISSVKIWTVNS